MARVFRGLLAVLLAVPFVPVLGCDSKKAGEANPDLKVPDVPPGDRGPNSKGGPAGQPDTKGKK